MLPVCLALVVMLSHQIPVAAQQPNPPPDRFQESVTLDVESSVVKKLRTIGDYIAVEQWEQAIEVLTDAAQNHGDSLIRVSPGRYLNVAVYANTLLAALPPAGLKAYRKNIDPRARRWLETGLRTRNPQPLERIVREAFSSSIGDDALLQLGDWAWEQGEIDRARGYWEQILPPASSDNQSAPALLLRFPDTDIPVAEVVARLVLASTMEGRLNRARRELAAFRRLYPDAAGSLAGEPGNLADILAGVIDNATSWTFVEEDVSVQTFAVNSRRNGILPHAPEVHGIGWSAPLPPVELELPNQKLALGNVAPLSYYPVVFNGIVLANDDDHIFAWNLADGSPAWADEGGSAIIYPPVPGVTSRQPIQRVSGTPRYTMTVADGRLYAKMGTPITSKAPNELAPLSSDLVCLDLASGQGKLVWKISAEEQGLGWAFEGSPLVADGRAYIALRRRHPQVQSNIACFDAATGGLLWSKKVASAVTGANDRRNLVSHNLLTLADDRLFYCTHDGAIAALRTADGTLEWVVTYELVSPDPYRGVGDVSKPGLTPCMYHRGMLFAAPSDSDRLFAIDADSGIIAWTRHFRGGVRHLLGAVGDTLVVSGDHLWALDLLRGGRLIWNIAYADPTAHGYGRGIVAGNKVYWPMREELFVVNYQSGSIDRRIPLAAVFGQTGGNLAIADGRLLIAQPDRLVAFGQSNTKPSAPSDKPVASIAPPWFSNSHRRSPAATQLSQQSNER